jgi:hypothetical protein
MKRGEELDREFALLSTVIDGQRVTAFGSGYDMTEQMVNVHELVISILISPKEQDHSDMLSGSYTFYDEDWQCAISGNGSIKPLLWLCQQIADIVRWAETKTWDIISFEGADKKRDRVFRKLLKRSMNKNSMFNPIEHVDGETIIRLK